MTLPIPTPVAAKADRSGFVTLWENPVTRIGVTTLLITAVLSLMPSAYLYLRYGVFPPLPIALKIWLTVAALFGAFYIVEPASYFPILGLPGTYMSFLSGNIANLRLPCSALAQEVVGVESGSWEAEIISVLGIAGSIITNTLFVTIAAMAGSAVLKQLPADIQAAFRLYTVPAIFGAIFGQFSIRYPRIAILSLVIAMAAQAFMQTLMRDDLQKIQWGWVAIAISVFGSILAGRLLYVKKWL